VLFLCPNYPFFFLPYFFLELFPFCIRVLYRCSYPSPLLLFRSLFSPYSDSIVFLLMSMVLSDLGHRLFSVFHFFTCLFLDDFQVSLVAFLPFYCSWSTPAMIGPCSFFSNILSPPDCFFPFVPLDPYARLRLFRR